MAVRAATLIADVGFEDLAVTTTAAGFGNAARVQSLLLHQREVQA